MTRREESARSGDVVECLDDRDVHSPCRGDDNKIVAIADTERDVDDDSTPVDEELKRSHARFKVLSPFRDRRRRAHHRRRAGHLARLADRDSGYNLWYYGTEFYGLSRRMPRGLTTGGIDRDSDRPECLSQVSTLDRGTCSEGSGLARNSVRRFKEPV